VSLEIAWTLGFLTSFLFEFLMTRLIVDWDTSYFKAKSRWEGGSELSIAVRIPRICLELSFGSGPGFDFLTWPFEWHFFPDLILERYSRETTTFDFKKCSRTRLRDHPRSKRARNWPTCSLENLLNTIVFLAINHVLLKQLIWALKWHQKSRDEAAN